MAIEKVVESFSKEELEKVAGFAYWNGEDQQISYDCDSCGSFCSGGACTTCTGLTDSGYLKKDYE